MRKPAFYKTQWIAADVECEEGGKVQGNEGVQDGRN